MAKAYITGDTATQVETGRVSRVLIQANAALTGTIKVIDGTSGTTANVATITNPTVGTRYEYWNFSTGVRVIASGACDITVSTK
jgi:hypothetical protein